MDAGGEEEDALDLIGGGGRRWEVGGHGDGGLGALLEGSS